jgi:predicted tellurium resistance membrane protein TerC
MMVAAPTIASFVHRHPTIKMLALAFLVLIGVTLIAEGLDQHIPKGYIYFSMAFSLGVEMLNMRLRKVAKPVKLHERYAGEASASPPPPLEQAT